MRAFDRLFTAPVAWYWRAVAALVVPGLLIVLWAIGSDAGWLPEQILPPPSFVWGTFMDMMWSGEFARNGAASAVRVLAGFGIGAGLGLVVGLCMGLSPTFEDYVKPLFTAVAQVPTIGWIPLLMLFLGVGEALKITIIAKAAFVPMVINTAAGIHNIPRAYMEVSSVFRLTTRQTLRQLILPAIVPSVFTGIRYSLTRAWTALVAVELLASTNGLGYLLVWGRQMFWLDVVLAAMLVIGIIGFVMDSALSAGETRLQKWRLTAE